jgi:hypothetical protein
MKKLMPMTHKGKKLLPIPPPRRVLSQLEPMGPVLPLELEDAVGFCRRCRTLHVESCPRQPHGRFDPVMRCLCAEMEDSIDG